MVRRAQPHAAKPAAGMPLPPEAAIMALLVATMTAEPLEDIPLVAPPAWEALMAAEVFKVEVVAAGRQTVSTGSGDMESLTCRI